jgi:hypothetical protein
MENTANNPAKKNTHDTPNTHMDTYGIYNIKTKLQSIKNPATSIKHTLTSKTPQRNIEKPSKASTTQQRNTKKIGNKTSKSKQKQIKQYKTQPKNIKPLTKTSKTQEKEQKNWTTQKSTPSTCQHHAGDSPAQRSAMRREKRLQSVENMQFWENHQHFSIENDCFNML